MVFPECSTNRRVDAKRRADLEDNIEVFLYIFSSSAVSKDLELSDIEQIIITERINS
jgi:hypothetical protein